MELSSSGFICGEVLSRICLEGMRKTAKTLAR